MLAGRPPFGAESHEELVAKALALNYTLDDVISLGARQLIDSMLQVHIHIHVHVHMSS